MPTSCKPTLELHGGQQEAPPAPCNALHQALHGSWMGQSDPTAGIRCTQLCLQPLPVTAGPQWWITGDRQQPSNSPAQHKERPGAPKEKQRSPKSFHSHSIPREGVPHGFTHGMPPNSPSPHPPRAGGAFQGSNPHINPISKPPLESHIPPQLPALPHVGSQQVSATPRVRSRPEFLSLLLRFLYLQPAEALCPPSLPQLARLSRIEEKNEVGGGGRGGEEE